MRNKIKKIGILTLPLNTNYGGVLQAYALLTVLKNENYKAYFINRRWNNDRTDLIYKSKKWIYKNIISYNFTKFINDKLVPVTKQITSSEQMKNINSEEFDAIIVGSDQVWRFEHTTGVGNNYFLDFVEKNKTKKISYAASFGVDSIVCDEERKNIVKKLLSEFDAISVREDSGVDICKSQFKVLATQVIDPTLLLNREDYLKLVDKPQKNKIQKRLTTYILDDSLEKSVMVKKIANNLSLTPYAVNKNINMNDIKSIIKNINNIVLPSISDWIRGINEADFILTDSFHGTVFSIIFNKQFICIGNKERGLTRFTSLLKIFNLEERLVFNESDITNALLTSEIDFNNINKILNEKRKEALNFLRNNI